ncbi:MAG: DUF6776 family protein [Thiotrichales bacterium]
MLSLLMFVAAGVLAYLAWQKGGVSFGLGGADETAVTVSHQQKVAFLEQKNDELARELAMVKRSNDIDDKASEKLVQTLAERERETQDLQERLSVCEALIAADDGKGGLAIHNLAMIPMEESGQYLLKMSLTNSQAGKRSVKGTVQVQVQGKLRGEIKTYEWSQIAAKDKSKLDFDFQYFVRIEGMVRLPEHFEPESIIVKAKPGGGGAAVQHSFGWNTVEKRLTNHVGQK